jgi:signal transduction histidine kinase
VDEASRIVHDDFSEIGADLRLVAQLVQAADTVRDRSRQIGALLAASKQYHAVGIYDLSGARILSVRDPVPAADLRLERFDGAMHETARTALTRAPGELVTTAPLELNVGWFRIFATSLPLTPVRAPGVVAVVVDTQELFAKLKLISAEPGSHLVLLGAQGRPTSATDPLLAEAIVAPDPSGRPQLSALVTEMRGGKRGLVTIDARESQRLGLGDAEVVAAYAPIQFQGRGQWSVATLTSTAKLAAHERALVFRLGLAAVAVSLCLIGFGAYFVVAARRAGALRERLRHSEHLALLHEKTEKILDNIPTGVMTFSSDVRMTSVNRALSERVPPSGRGRALDRVFPDAPRAVAAMLMRLLSDALESRQVRSLHGERLTLFGEEGQYNLHAVPLDPRFEEARILLVIEDLSEVRSLESQLIRAEKLSTIGVLAAGVAHEMGTPLGVVRGRAEYALGKIGRAHPQAPGMLDIIEQIDQVTRTIRQLLDFSRVSPPSAEGVALDKVVGDVVDLLRFEIERHKLSLSVDLPGDLPLLSADPDQLQQVMVNLVKNSCDSCAAQGHITIRARRDRGSLWSRVCLEVEDDGCGIPPAEQVRIFDPFFTTKKRGQGTGLGLTVAAQIVRNHGGEISVNSDGRRGTRMVVLWPAVEEARHGAAN